MTETRGFLLQELLNFTRPSADVVRDLSGLGWDSDQHLVKLEVADVVAMLSRFLSGEIEGKQVEDWANAIECRDDILVVPNSLVADVLHELANPSLTRALTRQSGAEWIAALGH